MAQRDVTQPVDRNELQERRDVTIPPAITPAPVPEELQETVIEPLEEQAEVEESAFTPEVLAPPLTEDKYNAPVQPFEQQGGSVDVPQNFFSPPEGLPTNYEFDYDPRSFEFDEPTSAQLESVFESDAVDYTNQREGVLRDNAFEFVRGFVSPTVPHNRYYEGYNPHLEHVRNTYDNYVNRKYEEYRAPSSVPSNTPTIEQRRANPTNNVASSPSSRLVPFQTLQENTESVSRGGINFFADTGAVALGAIRSLFRLGHSTGNELWDLRNNARRDGIGIGEALRRLPGRVGSAALEEFVTSPGVQEALEDLDTSDANGIVQEGLPFNPLRGQFGELGQSGSLSALNYILNLPQGIITGGIYDGRQALRRLQGGGNDALDPSYATGSATLDALVGRDFSLMQPRTADKPYSFVPQEKEQRRWYHWALGFGGDLLLGGISDAVTDTVSNTLRRGATSAIRNNAETLPDFLQRVVPPSPPSPPTTAVTREAPKALLPSSPNAPRNTLPIPPLRPDGELPTLPRRNPYYAPSSIPAFRPEGSTVPLPRTRRTLLLPPAGTTRGVPLDLRNFKLTSLHRNVPDVNVPLVRSSSEGVLALPPSRNTTSLPPDPLNALIERNIRNANPVVLPENKVTINELARIEGHNRTEVITEALDELEPQQPVIPPLPNTTNPLVLEMTRQAQVNNNAFDLPVQARVELSTPEGQQQLVDAGIEAGAVVVEQDGALISTREKLEQLLLERRRIEVELENHTVLPVGIKERSFPEMTPEEIARFSEDTVGGFEAFGTIRRGERISPEQQQLIDTLGLPDSVSPEQIFARGRMLSDALREGVTPDSVALLKRDEIIPFSNLLTRYDTEYSSVYNKALSNVLRKLSDEEILDIVSNASFYTQRVKPGRKLRANRFVNTNASIPLLEELSIRGLVDGDLKGINTNAYASRLRSIDKSIGALNTDGLQYDEWFKRLVPEVETTDLTPQLTQSEFFEAVLRNPLAVSMKEGVLKERSNEALTELAKSRGIIPQTRNTPLTNLEAAQIQNAHGNDFAKYGKEINEQTVNAPVQRMVVSEEPRKTALIENTPLPENTVENTRELIDEIEKRISSIDLDMSFSSLDGVTDEALLAERKQAIQELKTLRETVGSAGEKELIDALLENNERYSELDRAVRIFSARGEEIPENLETLLKETLTKREALLQRIIPDAVIENDIIKNTPSVYKEAYTEPEGKEALREMAKADTELLVHGNEVQRLETQLLELGEQWEDLELEMELVSPYARQPIGNEQATRLINNVETKAPRNTPTQNSATLLEDTFYHGTRVEGLEWENVDPRIGSAPAEFGEGLYFTTSPETAELYAKAAMTHNVPRVETQRFTNHGTVHEVRLRADALLNANEPAPELVRDIFKQELAKVLRREGNSGSKEFLKEYSRITRKEPLSQYWVTMREMLTGEYPVSETTMRELQGAVRDRLERAQYDGVEFVGENGEKIVTVFNGTQVQEVTKNIIETREDTMLEALTARVQADEIMNTHLGGHRITNAYVLQSKKELLGELIQQTADKLAEETKRAVAAVDSVYDKQRLADGIATKARIRRSDIAVRQADALKSEDIRAYLKNVSGGCV